MDRPGKVANPARGQLNRENKYFPCSRSCLRIGPPETGSSVPPRVSLLILHTQAESGPNLRDSSRFPRWHPLIYSNRHPPSGQSRVCRVITQLRTDSVYCQESAGTGPVVLKVVPNGCCLGKSPWTNNKYAPLFSHPHCYRD